MSEQELSPKMQAEMDHLDGKHVVVEYVYANGTGTRFLLQSLDEDSDATALWADVSFDNGPPLVEIRMRWDPKLADELRSQFTEQERDEQEPA